MSKKKIERVSIIHREKILWLKWYFMRDKENPKYSVLERKMFDAAKNQDMIAYQKYATIKQMTDIRVQTSEDDILKLIKEVFVFERINVVGACQRILFITTSPAYVKINKWFETYSDLYFSIVPLADLGLYHEVNSNSENRASQTSDT